MTHPLLRLEAIVSIVSVVSDFPINYRLAVIGGEEGLEDDANSKYWQPYKLQKRIKRGIS